MKISRRSIPYAALLVSAIIAGVAGAATSQAQAPTKTPPANTTLPTISGSPSVGATLTASTGTWSGNSLKFSFRWHRCDAVGGNCVSVAGGQSYVLAAADTDSRMRVVVTATNSAGSASATSAATAAVTGPSSSTPVIGPSTLPAATAGTAYSQTISVTGGSGSHTVRVTNGTLAPGLQLSSSGSLSGTPTSAGTYAFTVSAFNSTGTYVAYRDYSLPVAAGTGTTTPVIGPSTLPGATAGAVYSQTISVTGGSGSHTVRVTNGTLPLGLLLSSSGSLAGTPTSGGTYAFTVSAFNSTGTYVAYRDYSLAVAAGTTTVISPPSTTPSDSPWASWFLADPWSPSAWPNRHFSFAGDEVKLTAHGDSPVLGPATTFPRHLVSVYKMAGGLNGLTAPGADSWWRTRVTFPSDFAATRGDQNWLLEWHTASGDGASKNSIGIGVGTDFPSNGDFYSGPGTNPRWRFRPTGPAGERWYTGPAIQTGRTYDVLVNIKWSNGAGARFAVWIDGQLVTEDLQSNLYSGDTPGFGLYHYRLATAWTSSVGFSKPVYGSTRLSVGG